jgi:hypothetical protein
MYSMSSVVSSGVGYLLAASPYMERVDARSRAYMEGRMKALADLTAPEAC